MDNLFTNLEEYQDPEIYDLENAPSDLDESFYLSLAHEVGGPVLELGCGTGRMTIPMAKAGLEITGLDVTSAMLEQARRKAGDLPIQWMEADVRSFHLGRQFNFIFECGSVFMHMLSNADQRAFLQHVYEHLADAGRFVFSVLFPHPRYLQTLEAEEEWYTIQDDKGRTIKVSGYQTYDELSQVVTETAIRRIKAADGNESILEAPLRKRYTFPQEMEALLDANGFIIKERYGGPDRSALTSASMFMVYICAKK